MICNYRVILGCTLVAGLSLAGAAYQSDETPAWMVDKETKTPYLSQSDPALASGPDYGAPAAVTNSFIWFARHGYANLMAPGVDDYHGSAIKTMVQLASAGFMTPAPRRGGVGGGPGGGPGGRPGAAGGGGKDTEPGSLMSGARLFVEEHGYKTSVLAYQGWRQLPGSLDTAGDTPDISFLKKMIAMPNTAVWLNLGWYTQSSPGEFQRNGGQWVTLVGFRKSRINPDDTVLLVHNPSKDSPAGTVSVEQSLTDNAVALHLLTTGNLNGSEANLPHTAVHFYAASGKGLPIPTTGGSILDGAVVMQLAKAN
jgi:hypothetical protein